MLGLPNFDTVGEPKKWEEILRKQGIFSSQWGLFINVHTQSEESILTTIEFANSITFDDSGKHCLLVDK